MTTPIGRPHIAKDLQRLANRVYRLETWMRQKPEQRRSKKVDIPYTAHCEITKATNQVISGEATDTTLEFDTTYNSNINLRIGNHIQIQKAGRYLVWANVKWLYSDGGVGRGGYRSLHVSLNDASNIIDDHIDAPENTGVNPDLTHNVSRVVSLAVGDYLKVKILWQHQQSSGPFTIISGTTSSAFLGVSYQGE